MANDSIQPAASATADATPPFPHAAAPQPPLEPAERQYADRPRGVPGWQPEDGDFN